ncbi:HlyD family secretion protein [Granulicella rosea]|uniref:HlyD family secretion protein n=1 Tax=Granulicella rosea TaxID=474952 RepID=A0A239GYL4_9BACT|nr:efflux RND transporter periplasmic adaptor subunit [Granulicella rosea]SNS74227.1 HlyD family secretion protein [Granulicella rosea]
MPNVEQPRRVGPALLWIAGAVIVVIIVFGVRALTHEQVGVRTSTATNQNLLSTVSTNGKVEPVEEFQAHAPYPGVIKEIYVDVGQVVKPGTPLLRMDDADVNAKVAAAESSLKSAQVSRNDLTLGGTQEERNRAAADLQNAQAEQATAARSLAQVQALQAKGAASAGEVASAQSQLDSANRTLAAAQSHTAGRYSKDDIARADAQVAEAQAGLAAAHSAHANANIVSPIPGTVYSIPVSQYDFVPAGDDLLDIADLNRIQIRAYFDEPEIGKLLRGQAVSIVWDAKPNQRWHGHIERAPTTVITYGTRNVGECLITVDDAKGDLLPNTNVTVTVTTSQRFNVLSIPREALHTDGASNFVYTVRQGKLSRTTVQVGVVNLTRVEITSGLKENDQIVVSATTNQELKNGLEVKPIE